MTCEQAIQLLSARLDGQISRDGLDALESHLETCPACREEAIALASQDNLLRRGFDEHRATALRIAEDVIAELPRRRLRIPGWLSTLTSAAAGFAIAWLIFHKPPVVPPPPIVRSETPPAAHLTLATGAVEAADSTGQHWAALPTGGAIAPGTRLRTGRGVRCELLNADGSQLRLNEKTEIVLTTARRFELVDGQAWSSVAHDAAHPFQALASAVTFTALGTQFDLQKSPNSHDATLTVVEGTVRVDDAAGSTKLVSSGLVFTCPDGHLGDQKPAQDLARATRWLNEILVMKGRDDPELSRRVNDLFAQIGQTKIDSLYEDEIRALGDHCVVPLTRYVESNLSANEPHKRILAARIVSDVATPKSIPDLLPLLQDSDGEVRAASASALKRLTGETLGRPVEKWRDDTVFQCAPSAHQWTNWWEKNKNLYPGVTDKPSSPMKKS